MRGMAAMLLAAAILAGPVMLLLGPPLPAAVDLHEQSGVLLLVGGASIAVCFRGRPGPAWRGLGALGLMLAAGGVVALPWPLPSIASSQGRLLASGVGAAVGLVVLALVVVPTYTGRGVRRARPGSIAWTLVATAAAGTAGAGLTALVVRWWPFVQGDPWAEWLVGGLVAEGGLILATIVLADGALLRPSLLTRPSLPGALGAGLAFAFGALLLSSMVAVVARVLGVDSSDLGNAPPLRTDQIPSAGLALVTDAVLPGVVEEAFFRGVLFGSLRHRQPLWLAGLVSSGVFALVHLDPSMSPAQLAVVGLRIFVCGCVYAAAYQSTGSLYVPMLAHALFDSVPAMGLSLGQDAQQVLGMSVLLAGYAVAAWRAGVPAIRRWRARWGFPEAYARGVAAETGTFWAALTASPPTAWPEAGEAARPGA